MKKYLLYIAILAVVVLSVAVAVAACVTEDADAQKHMQNNETDHLNDEFPIGNYLLTINEHSISTEEFDFFLNMERSTTAAYFGRVYNAQIDADFWERKYEGQTPTQYAKDAALRNIMMLYAQLDLGVAWGLLLPEEGNFEGFVKELDTENENRANMLEGGEVFFGLTEFDLPTFFHYRRSKLLSAMHFHQIGLNLSTEDELRELFAATMHMYGGGMDLVVNLIYEDGNEKRLHIVRDNIHREHLELATMYEVMLGMQVGDMVGGFAWEGEIVSVELVEQILLGFMSFADARPSVAANHANILLMDEINERVEDSVVRRNKDRWDLVRIQH
jgi:hypothetical protein